MPHGGVRAVVKPQINTWVARIPPLNAALSEKSPVSGFNVLAGMRRQFRTITQ